MCGCWRARMSAWRFPTTDRASRLTCCREFLNRFSRPSGRRIAGWDWRDQQGIFEHQQGVRWGSFWVAGTWDGTTFTYRDAIPSALYDPMPTEPSPLPTPAVRHSQAELEDIAGEVGGLPGVLSVYTDAGHVLLDVVYDDGSLQAWTDDVYGADVVVVRPALLDD